MVSNMGGGHTDGKAFLGCAYCTQAFPDKTELEVHERMTHVGAPFASVPAPIPEREKAHTAPTAAISKSMPLSEVERHCTPEDCWVAINGKIYDLTEFMDRHPGGPTKILSFAGKDASKVYNDIHKGVKIDQYLRPEALLGDLGVDENLMSDSFWHTLRKARIEEIKEDLNLLTNSDVLPPKARSVSDLLQKGNLDLELKAALKFLETQRRAALDVEDYTRAQQLTNTVESLLGDRVPLKPAPSGGIPLSEVSLHNKPHDCWVALNGRVYDLTDFLLQHPEGRNPVLAWAGRDASPMWNKIPGRFPSSTWMDFFMRPEACMGEVGPEPQVDPTTEQIRLLQEELRRLEGPSDEDIQAVKAGAAQASIEPLRMSEEVRFPRLREIASSKHLPFYTRAEVAKHKGPVGGPPGTEPYMILHNKVYNLVPLLENHPGGDDVLLSRAGTDATKDFELFEHSEKARVKRDQEMVVGQLVPAEHTDWAAEAAGAAKASVAKGAISEIECYMRHKTVDAALITVVMYAYWSFQKRKPLSKLTYSRALRHFHLLMAVGIFGSIASAQVASRSEGLVKKRFLAIHKQSGVAMFVALLVRIYIRARSGIPPRFPGHPIVRFVETQSLRVFYLLLLALPISGMANEYYVKWAPGADQAGSKGDDQRNDKMAKQALTVHKRLGKFLELVWLPFHLGYTVVYHYSQGRGVIRKVSPFI